MMIKSIREVSSGTSNCLSRVAESSHCEDLMISVADGRWPCPLLAKCAPTPSDSCHGLFCMFLCNMKFFCLLHFLYPVCMVIARRPCMV